LRLRTAASLCPAIYEYYGMQETGTLTVSTPADRERFPDSIGAPLALSDVRIERPDGTLAAPGELGEIVGRSPNTCTGYFDNPQKSAETFRGGYVHTGDLGMMNEEGFVFIKGRLKDMIISGGQNVHAACRERLAGFKIPRTIVIETEPLPRTPTGKVQKFLLVERFSPGG
jgi:acyl-CoA synthetase (AMP-forming)/AMP-acid ligase II